MSDSQSSASLSLALVSLLLLSVFRSASPSSSCAAPDSVRGIPTRTHSFVTSTSTESTPRKIPARSSSSALWRSLTAVTNVRSTASVVLPWLVLEVLIKNRPCTTAVRLEARASNSCWASTVPCAGRHKLLLLDVERPEVVLFSSSKRKPVDSQFTIIEVQWYPVVTRHSLHVGESAVGRQQAAAAFSSGDMTDCYVRDCKSQGANTRQCFGELPGLVMDRKSLWV